MANTAKYGFRAVQKHNGADAISHEYVVAASQTIAKDDPLSLDSAGRVIIAVSASTTQLLGTAAHVSSAAAVGTSIWVFDNPEQVFEAMVDTGALADPYTTRSAAAAFDLEGTTGAFNITTTSAQDLFKCVGLSKDPVTGLDSEVGANQMKLWKINPAAHIYGTIA